MVNSHGMQWGNGSDPAKSLSFNSKITGKKNLFISLAMVESGCEGTEVVAVLCEVQPFRTTTIIAERNIFFIHSKLKKIKT
jgi:hypothetical protein